MAADAPCARECTREVSPQREDFDSCYACGQSHPFQQAELGSIEIVLEMNYTRNSLLLGGVQSTLATTCVTLLEEEGMKVCQLLHQSGFHLHMLACIICLRIHCGCMLQSDFMLGLCCTLHTHSNFCWQHQIANAQNLPAVDILLVLTI